MQMLATKIPVARRKKMRSSLRRRRLMLRVMKKTKVKPVPVQKKLTMVRRMSETSTMRVKRKTKKPTRRTANSNLVTTMSQIQMQIRLIRTQTVKLSRIRRLRLRALRRVSEGTLRVHLTKMSVLVQLPMKEKKVVATAALHWQMCEKNRAVNKRAGEKVVESVKEVVRNTRKANAVAGGKKSVLQLQ